MNYRKIIVESGQGLTPVEGTENFNDFEIQDWLSLNNVWAYPKEHDYVSRSLWPDNKPDDWQWPDTTKYIILTLDEEGNLAMLPPEEDVLEEEVSGSL